jgi:hypothetical protein
MQKWSMTCLEHDFDEARVGVCKQLPLEASTWSLEAWKQHQRFEAQFHIFKSGRRIDVSLLYYGLQNLQKMEITKLSIRRRS